MSYLKKILYIFSMLFIALASLIGFLFTTTPGLYTSIKFANLFLPGEIHLHRATGQLINHFSFNTLSYDEDTLHIRLTEGSIHWKLTELLHHQLTVALEADQLTVKINGPAHHVIAPPFNLQIDKLAIKQIKVQHFDNAQQFNNLELIGTMNHHLWVIQSLKTKLATIHLALNGSGESNGSFPTTINLQFIQQQGLQGNITLNGDLALYRWQGQFNGPAQGNIRGTLKNGLNIHSEAHWYDATWPFKTTTLKASQGNLTIDGTVPDFMLKTDMLFETPIKAQWQLTAHVKNKRADVNSTIYFPQGHLKTIISAKGSVYGTQNATLKFTINPGTYQFPPDSPLPILPFKGGDIFVNLSPKSLDMKGLFTIDQYKTINVALSLPNFRWEELTTTRQNIDGKLNLQINSQDFLQGLSKAGETLRGQLQMKLTAKGTVAKPIVNGELLFTNASLFIPKSGITFAPIQLKLQSSNHHWQTQGVITSNGHALTLKGQGDFSPRLTGKLTLIGDDFPAIKTADYNINVSPQLAMQINPKSIDITGNILVPSALLKPLSFSNTVSLSEDVVFISKDKTTATNPFNLSTDVHIKMGQNVDLDVKGLRGFLDGAIRIQQSPHSASRATGELSLRDAKYKAYGQDLIIEQGQLVFSGGLTDSPSLHIRAIRKFDDNNSKFASTDRLLDFSATNIDTIDIGSQTTVGVELTGRLNAHKIRLFSIPANLSQSDILSLLILGKPANQASKSGGQLLLAAISSMNLDSGTKGLQLLSQLKQSLGIDFNVQNNTPYNQAPTQGGENTTVVVGKSLSKRIYVSYNIGVLQNDSNVLTLKYLLNKYFSIQVTTSDTGNGLDLLYTHIKD